MKVSYAQAGVDVRRGQEAVQKMKAAVEATYTPDVLAELGSFAGFFRVPDGYDEPVLVSGTDGVGTKILLAKELGDFSGLGQDLVAMCVNDILCHGAKPLFFLDYLASARLEPDVVVSLVESIARACTHAGCALIGGESAEMPGVYAPGDVDMAGFCVGIVERSKIIDGTTIEAGDVLIGLASSGVHSNGYSLIRKLFLELYPDELASFAEELLRPTHLYTEPLAALWKKVGVKGMAHITGGGFFENIPRMLPKGLSFDVDTRTWPRSALYQKIAQLSQLDEEELFSTFNMGIGMVIALSPDELEAAHQILNETGWEAYTIGVVVEGEEPCLR